MKASFRGLLGRDPESGLQRIPFSLSYGFGHVTSFAQDIRTLYRRARYGWAPRDVWSLDYYYYLNGVLAGALVHLAESTHGAPLHEAFATCASVIRGPSEAALPRLKDDAPPSTAYRLS